LANGCITRLTPFSVVFVFVSSGLHEWIGGRSWAIEGRECKAEKTAKTGMFLVGEFPFAFACTNNNNTKKRGKKKTEFGNIL